MRGRDGKGPPATDLLVCFPSRAHLSLLPKPICSPARPSDSSILHHHHHRHHRRPSHHNLRKSGNNRTQGSPLLWARTKHHNSDISEPTSPKVTCAGQIKVRSKPSSCKNWQSVMEEIERLHNSRKQKRRPNWMEAFGFKKDVMQFLTCLRNIRFDFRCFGSIPAAEITSDDDEEEDDDEDQSNCPDNGGDQGSSGAVFSKWFMILQEENLSKEMIRVEESSKRRVIRPHFDEGLAAVEADDDDDDAPCAPPPPDALLLMRCRSAPAKSWLEEREAEEEEGERSESEECDEVKEKEEETNFCEFAVEITKENRIQEKISRSRSWKR